MKRYLILLLFAVPLHAQSLPFKPLPTVQVHMTDGQKKWWEPLPARRPTANPAFWGRTALSAALTVADVENSVYALRRSGTHEANPILGSHPSRAEYYALAAPVAAGMAYLDWRYTREDNALRDASLPPHKWIKGWLPQTLNAGVHVFGILVTLASTGR